MSLKLAINGFGRIGRAVFKSILEKQYKVDIVAINDLTDNNTLAHLLKYDSIYGIYNKKVKSLKDGIMVDKTKYKVLAIKEPQNLPWKELNVDVVLECTGFFTTYEASKNHLIAGAKKVVISAPSKSKEVNTYVLGVNDNKIRKNEKIISNASCTTNCIAPVMNILEENFHIEKAFMTTVHSYTADQNLVDGPHRKLDLRRARAAAENIVPTTTGAAIAVTKTIPRIQNKFDGLAIRVPTPIGSLADIVALVGKNVDVKSVNEAFLKASKSPKYKNFVTATYEPIVSTDTIKNPYSAIVDLSLTKVIDKNLIKVIAWYDNEWGYAKRLIELAMKII